MITRHAGSRPFSSAAAERPSAADELVVSSMNRLFPGEGSGYSSFPGVSLGVGIGTGGRWGLGGGLHF